MRLHLARLVLAGALGLAAGGAAGCRPALAVAVGVDEVDAAAVARAAGSAAAPLVLDLRAPADYRAGHIRGAVSVSPADLDAYLATAPAPATRRVVTVCYRGRL